MCSFSSLQNKTEHKLRNVLWRMYTGRLVLAGLTKPKPRVWDNRDDDDDDDGSQFSLLSQAFYFRISAWSHKKGRFMHHMTFLPPKRIPLSAVKWWWNRWFKSYKEHRKTIKCNSVANNMKLVQKKLVNLGIYFTAVN